MPMGNPVLPLEGGCHCGAVRYRVSAAPMTVYNCHCKNCQKITGSAFVVSAMIPAAGFAIVQGTPARFEWKADSGARRFGYFCGDCGSRLAHGQVPSSGVVSLRAGTLDDTSWIEPVGDIWTKSAQPGVRFGQLTAAAQPQDYSPFIERFRAQRRFPA
jgi:hypothetical protein